MFTLSHFVPFSRDRLDVYSHIIFYVILFYKSYLKFTSPCNQLRVSSLWINKNTVLFLCFHVKTKVSSTDFNQHLNIGTFKILCECSYHCLSYHPQSQPPHTLSLSLFNGEITGCPQSDAGYATLVSEILPSIFLNFLLHFF